MPSLAHVLAYPAFFNVLTRYAREAVSEEPDEFSTQVYYWFEALLAEPSVNLAAAERELHPALERWYTRVGLNQFTAYLHSRVEHYPNPATVSHGSLHRLTGINGAEAIKALDWLCTQWFEDKLGHSQLIRPQT